MKRLSISTIALFVFGIPSYGQNALNNFSFETPSAFTLGITSSTVATGFNTTTTWNVTRGSVDVVPVGPGGSYWTGATAANGQNVLDLSGYQRGTIQQTISVPSGNGKANLSFNYSRSLDYTGTNTFTGQVRLFSGSTVYLTQSFTRNAGTDGASASTFNWSTFTISNVSLTNAPSTLTLEFADLTPNFVTTGDITNNSGIVLDNVSLATVPEPTTIVAMSSLGLSALGYRVRKMFRS